MKDSLKHSIQSNHNLFCKVFWVTGNFSIIFAVLKIIMPLISFLERLPGYFMHDSFFTLLGKKSSCIQIAIDASNAMESDCLLHLMSFNYFMFLILYLCCREWGTRGRERFRQVLGQMDQRGFGHKNSSENEHQTQ